MGIFKSILKPFVEFGQGTGPAGKEEEAKTVEPPKTDNDNVHRQVAKGSADGSPYKKYFEDLIEEANNKNPLFQGTDIKEFIDSKVDVEAITDEATKYKTAFNVLKRTGLTKERLLSTGKEYLRIIEADIKGFETAFREQYKTEVEQKEALLQKKAEELQSLTDRIAQLNEEMKKMSQQIVQSKDKLNANKASFITAGEDKKMEIEAELQKIGQYF